MCRNFHVMNFCIAIFSLSKLRAILDLHKQMNKQKYINNENTIYNEISIFLPRPTNLCMNEG